MATSTTTIELIANGPAKITGTQLEITLPDGTVETREGSVFLCRCGQSRRKPYCDGAHKDCGFEG